MSKWVITITYHICNEVTAHLPTIDPTFVEHPSSLLMTGDFGPTVVRGSESAFKRC